MRIQALGWKDPLEECMATHSSILAWRIPQIEEPGGLQSMGSQDVTGSDLTPSPVGTTADLIHMQCSVGS